MNAAASKSRDDGWATANQRCLMAELAVLDTLLDAPHSGDGGAEGSPEVRAWRDARDAMPSPSALDGLCATFGLSGFERRVLGLCAGVELDGRFAARLAAAPGSGGHAWPSFGLALAAFPDEAHWDALAASGPLRHWRLVEFVGGSGQGSLVMHALRLDERILFYLTGVPVTEERFAGLVQPVPSGKLPASQNSTLKRLADAWAGDGSTAPPVLGLCGPDASARRAFAAGLGARVGRSVFSLSTHGLPTHPGELESLHRLWEREARLTDAALLLECDQPEGGDAPARELAIDRWIEWSRTPLLVSSREPRPPATGNGARPFLTADLARPTAAEQRLVWQQALGATAAGALNGQLERVVSQFDFSAATIHAAAGRFVGDDLWETCRRHARPRLEGLAQHIPSRARWENLILPAPQTQTLREIATQVRHRAKVCEDWGFAEQSGRGLGLSALFCGPSGTGKTLAAEILANELRLDLFRVDLSAVVSKYIGETEKNLRRVFDAAEEGGAVLLFDEADALFGKRSEVKDSHDRYANVEVSYLLQRMEAYRGLAVLTTNMKDALDPAFLRRLRFVVQFPFPDAVQRAEIWRRIFPAKTPTDALDFSVLARLSVSGGNIRSIALNAAFAAADACGPVLMSHVLRAARLEYEKLEKPLTAAETGGWQ